ncbi:MAG: hypothetical protein JWQ07_3778 [Ramlibacter sp.]|nr:hypothetical protein [Ramlibacter sp.]
MQASRNQNANDPTSESHRQAYNAAFEELGLNWHWDPVTYSCLVAPGPEGVRAYLETEHPHLLRAYEADFLVNAIQTAKDRCYQVMVSNRAGSYGRRAPSYAIGAPA